jgi:hypothetical protein
MVTLIVVIVAIASLGVLTWLAGRSHTKPLLDWIEEEDRPIANTYASWDDNPDFRRPGGPEASDLQPVRRKPKRTGKLS